jgi:hypothetical protein
VSYGELLLKEMPTPSLEFWAQKGLQKDVGLSKRPGEP